MSSKLLAGRYELIEKIGEGGMAVVYKAKDRLLNRYIAIKILRPEFTKNAQFVENFKRESQSAAGLQHPNIVSVYDVGKEGDIHFIVMELIDGRPLSEIVKEKAPMDYKSAIEITKQVAAALSVAHRNNIIHRDVKPHNIMITKDGLAKLTDFGIAKAVSDSTLVSETSRIIGSVHYFSPEQARGAYVDERSDIYSLGIVLYEMLTGQVPFDGDNPVQIALMHINDEITPPSELVGGIPPALEKLVMKATDKYQSNRYKNADELLEELNNIEFVTKMVGNSIFAADEIEDFRKNNAKNADKKQTVAPVAGKPSKNGNNKPEKEKSNKKKPLIIILIIIVLLALLGVLYATGVIGGAGKIEVPNLENMSYAEAEDALNKVELKIKKGDPVPSDTVKADKVASQNPEAGDKVSKGSTVTVNLSSGKETGAIPSLVGKTYDSNEIKKYLKQFGFVLGDVTYSESTKYDKGIIIEQSPSAGNEADEGTYVSIVVSSGKKATTSKVPTLTGLNVEAAKQAIVDAGFVVGSVSYEENSVYEKNIVMWQEYSANSSVNKGASISIKVSKGEPEVVTTPDNQNDSNTNEDDSDSTDQSDSTDSDVTEDTDTTDTNSTEPSVE